MKLKYDINEMIKEIEADEAFNKPRNNELTQEQINKLLSDKHNLKQ